MAKVARFTQDNQNPVGMIVPSMLTEAQFQAINGTAWVLAAGQSAVGSVYATTTGSSTLPDLRGMTLRGKNNSRADGSQNPNETITGLTYNTSSATVTGFTTANQLINTIIVGQTVTGVGIPSGTTVASKGATSIVLSNTPTSAGTELTFLGELPLGMRQDDAMPRLTGDSPNGPGLTSVTGVFESVYVGLIGTGAGYGSNLGRFDSARQAKTSASETRMKNVTVNYFIKIN